MGGLVCAVRFISRCSFSFAKRIANSEASRVISITGLIRECKGELGYVG